MKGAPLIVEDRHFEYLRIQKGNLDELAHDRARWLAAYQGDLERQFESFREYLPAKCTRFLDVGSGLGGIDVLIRREYERRGIHPHVWLLDGVSDAPHMRLHRQTFNDMRVAKDFHVKNGADPARFSYWSPTTILPGPCTEYDLVVSFGSWCFHYPPDTYLAPLLKSGIHADTVFVLDVRATKASWARQLEEVFDLVAIVAERPKWNRCIYRPRAVPK